MNNPRAFLDFLVTLYDPHGDPHSAQVTDHATMLATSAQIGKQEILNIQIAARYHDIGKIGIPESIRRLPGIFTPIERYTMQKHVEIGAQMLQLLDFEPNIIAIVLSHHENFDGSGYPSMLHSYRIPIGARIIRIVDSFDALTNVRGYKQACSKQRALERLHEASTYYDPDLLDLFEKVIKESWTDRL